MTKKLTVKEATLENVIAKRTLTFASRDGEDITYYIFSAEEDANYLLKLAKARI